MNDVNEVLPPSLHFGARELKPYAEPVSSDVLEEGEVYFSINFADENMTIPAMAPLVFIGRNLREEDEGVVLYFQDFDSHKERSRNSLNDRSGYQSGVEGLFKHVFEYERALEVLMRCSLRRTK